MLTVLFPSEPFKPTMFDVTGARTRPGTPLPCCPSTQVQWYVPSGEWHHILVPTTEPSPFEVYIDGQHLFPIGGQYIEPAFAGAFVSDLAIYERELSIDEASRLYNMGAPMFDSQDPNLLAWWRVEGITPAPLGDATPIVQAPIDEPIGGVPDLSANLLDLSVEYEQTERQLLAGLGVTKRVVPRTRWERILGDDLEDK